LPFPAYFLSFGVFAIATFAFGLVAGMSAINRKFFVFSIFGVSLLTVCGILVSIPFDSSTSWEIGSPIMALSLVSAVLIARSKTEFT